VSLVNGYTLGALIVPSTPDKDACNVVNCDLTLEECPENEILNLGSLKYPPQNPTMCLSPCYKDTYPSPYGRGLPNNVYPGDVLCCPTPPIDVETCRNGPVSHSKYVDLIHTKCPTAYSYAYDDINGNHNCE